MAHFVDKFRYKLDDNKVVMSVTVNENMVTEHRVPISEMVMMVESTRVKNNFQSYHIGVKFLRSGVILKLRENEFTRQIYKFNESDFQTLISQLRRSVNLKENGSTDNNPEDIPYEQEIANTIVSTVEPIVTSMFSSFAEERNQSLNLAISLKSQVNDLQNQIQSLKNAIQSLTDHIHNLPVQMVNVGDHAQSPTNDLDSEMPMYIPSSVKTEYEGKLITSVQQTEDETVETAMNLLKQIKKKGKKK